MGDRLTFQAHTRKSTRWGTGEDRTVRVHPDLKVHLKRYAPPPQGYLFASHGKSGHITRRAVDNYWRRRFINMGFSGFSTHSSRRWLINKLGKTTRIQIIAEFMKMRIETVRHYLDDDPNACDEAILNVSV